MVRDKFVFIAWQAVQMRRFLADFRDIKVFHGNRFLCRVLYACDTNVVMRQHCLIRNPGETVSLPYEKWIPVTFSAYLGGNKNDKEMVIIPWASH